MAQDKELLLKDLCARLPYGVKMTHIADDDHCPKTLIGIAKDMITLEGNGGYSTENVEEFKPYLFPLSSMTTEQRCELHDLIHNLNVLAINGEIGDWIVSSSEIDWYNKNHFDYRGLIPMGLAIDATGLNIY